jgi:hypothetical protein
LQRFVEVGVDRPTGERKVERHPAKGKGEPSVACDNLLQNFVKWCEIQHDPGSLPVRATESALASLRRASG